ncbi:MAG: DEAD/DEAH box helicase [Desulfuromonas sp.]|nr:DEAD/DEAH box helicase [Desulfuromonas sp.]
MSFSSLCLCEPLLRAIDELGYDTPTPIQLQAIPAVLAGRDVLAAAQTGTGKTAGFTLPLLQRLTTGPRLKGNHVRALVLTPTRELAVQVADSVAAYGRFLPLKSAVAYGGVKINPQMMKLRGGVDVLVATPGRLIDLYRQNALRFDQLETLVLDEADRMLDLGFSYEIGKILAMLPQKRQNLLFSATFSDEIRSLTNGLLNQPVQIEVSPRNTTAKSVKQWVYEVDKGRKPELLSHLIRSQGWQQLLVFTRTKKGADSLAKQLERDGISTAVIHGDKSQRERSRALGCFKGNRVRVLVATDVAARGIDITELPHVVNFDLPKVAEDYIHRIGRTGRAGYEGQGISLVSADEVKLLSAVESLIGQLLPREMEQGFEPLHGVPASILRTVRPKKPKKAKTPKQELDQKLERSDNQSDKRGEERRQGLSEGQRSAGDQKRGGKAKPRRGAPLLDSGSGKSSTTECGKQRRDGNASPSKRRSAAKPGRNGARKNNPGRRR